MCVRLSLYVHWVVYPSEYKNKSIAFVTRAANILVPLEYIDPIKKNFCKHIHSYISEEEGESKKEIINKSKGGQVKEKTRTRLRNESVYK